MSNWYAVRTLSQQERTFTTRVERVGISAFCPIEQIEKRQRHPSKRGKVTVGLVTRPLLVGYTLVLMDGNPASWIALRETHGFISVVGFENRAWPIPIHQVHHLRALSGQARYMPKPKKIAPGASAKLVDGAFAGRIVRVESVTDKRAMVLLGMLGKESISVPVEQLEAA